MQPCSHDAVPMAMQQHGGRCKSLDVAHMFEARPDPVQPPLESEPTLTVDPQYQLAVAPAR
jgi:hypothetical protein